MMKLRPNIIRRIHPELLKLTPAKDVEVNDFGEMYCWLENKRSVYTRKKGAMLRLLWKSPRTVPRDGTHIRWVQEIHKFQEELKRHGIAI